MPKPINFHTSDNRGRPGDSDASLQIDTDAHKAKMDYLNLPSRFKDDPDLKNYVPDLPDDRQEPYVPVTLMQSDYNAIVEHARAHGKTVINIPKFHATEHLDMAMDIPHNFHGFNTVGEVPEGSYIGDGSAIEPDTVINNCNLGASVLVGDYCKLNNCKIGPSCSAGQGIELNGCEIQMLFEAESVFAKDTVIMGMCDIRQLTVSGDCVVYPGLAVDKLDVYGHNNVIGDSDLEIPENAHKSNLHLSPDFTQTNVYNFEPRFIDAKDGVPPAYTSVRSELQVFVKQVIDDKLSEDAEHEVSPSGPRM